MGVPVRLMVVLFFVLIASGASAQTFRVELGRSRSSVAWLWDTPEDCEGCAISAASNTDRTAFTGGLLVRFDRGAAWGLETGLRFVPKGFEVTGPTFHMLYAEVPLVGVLQALPDRGPFAEGGVVVGLLAACRRFMDTSAGFHEDGCGRVTTAYGRELEPLRRWDASWAVALGIRVPTPRGALTASFRMERSIFDIQPGEASEKMENRVAMFVVGVEWDPWRLER